MVFNRIPPVEPTRNRGTGWARNVMKSNFSRNIHVELTLNLRDTDWDLVERNRNIPAELTLNLGHRLGPGGKGHEYSCRTDPEPGGQAGTWWEGTGIFLQN